jgi:hypothetical protein
LTDDGGDACFQTRLVETGSKFDKVFDIDAGSLFTRKKNAAHLKCFIIWVQDDNLLLAHVLLHLKKTLTV